MAKFELTKSIEARKLNKRTMIPAGSQTHTIPFGAIIENRQLDRDDEKFTYLGEPYIVSHDELDAAAKPL